MVRRHDELDIRRRLVVAHDDTRDAGDDTVDQPIDRPVADDDPRTTGGSQRQCDDAFARQLKL